MLGLFDYAALAQMGFCPEKKYGWMKRLPEGFEVPGECPHCIFVKMPLQLQVMYEQYPDAFGYHWRRKSS